MSFCMWKQNQGNDVDHDEVKVCLRTIEHAIAKDQDSLVRLPAKGKHSASPQGPPRSQTETVLPAWPASRPTTP